MVNWVPSRHPEQVRSAQAAALLRQRNALAGTMLLAMCVLLAVQLHTGFGWAALAWQLFMVTLAFVTLSSLQAAPKQATQSGPRAVIVCVAAFSLVFSIGVIGWANSSPADLTALTVAMTFALPTCAAATFHVVPLAWLAFSVPVFVASICVTVLKFPTAAASAGVAMIVVNAAAISYFLRKNWEHFTRAVDLDAEKSSLAEMLHQQKEIAERSVHLKTRFLASASHDLRQPMHAISLYLDGLAEIELPERARRAVADARECAHDMNDMFRSLLDISRLDAQQAVPSLGVFAIATILSRVEKEFTPLARSRDVRFAVRPCPEHVFSDPVMVERIALNFVSNAIRHSSGGRVLVACRRRGRALRLAVYDSGKGIPADQQQAIFDEFHRLDSAPQPDHTGGLGLGLAIVRRLAQAIRAPVVVRSTPGRGSMFAVDLPFVQVAAEGRDATQCEGNLAGKLIVLVDDEASILQAASFILEKAGCAVVLARSGKEALENLASSARVPDAIVCDYELKDELKGPAVIQALREEFNSNIPALLVTGDTGGGAAERLAREMEVPMLYKPLESAALRSSLGSLLSTEEQ